VADRARRKPTGAARKISEAMRILQGLKVPKEQQNERSALSLLALLDMKPGKRWAEAEAPMLGITEMMNPYGNCRGAVVGVRSRGFDPI